jgi:hypothetical protein
VSHDATPASVFPKYSPSRLQGGLEGVLDRLEEARVHGQVQIEIDVEAEQFHGGMGARRELAPLLVVRQPDSQVGGDAIRIGPVGLLLDVSRCPQARVPDLRLPEIEARDAHPDVA